MSLTGRWIDLIYRTATGSWKMKIILAPLVGLSFFGLICLFIFLSLLIDPLMQFPKLFDASWALIIGVPVILVGFILMAVSASYFIKVKGTPVPMSPPPVLITGGPYRYARNPMITGLFIILFGVGILCNSLSLIFIFTPLFIMMNYWELKKVEEPELERRLGQEYVNYKKRVPMFFPWRKN